MAGDPRQLPPTLQSDAALDAQLDRTLFDRLQDVGAPEHPIATTLPSVMLEIIYAAGALHRLEAHTQCLDPACHQPPYCPSPFMSSNAAPGSLQTRTPSLFQVVLACIFCICWCGCGPIQWKLACCNKF